MEILLKILPRAHLGQNTFEDALVVFEQFFQRIGSEVFARLEIDELTEREAVQPILACDRVELGVVVLSTTH